MASSSSLSLSASFSGNWVHPVFPSFHGPDVRSTLLTHMFKELKSKGIMPFIDNEIKRGEHIGPALKRAIRGSEILIVLLSRRYASSSWCLDELVEIMKKESGQKVMAVFCNLDPSDVKKQTGFFGEVFKETCEGKTEEKIGTWKEALESVATIAGYHLKEGVDEAVMMEKIAVDISNELNSGIPSLGFGCLIGMEDHMERLESWLLQDLNEVKMIGIWGSCGIGKSTIARCLYNQFSNSFEVRLLMVGIKEEYPRPCLNEGSVQLELQRKMLSKMLNHEVMEITDLGVAQKRLHNRKVFLVLDEVDSSAQLKALAGGKQWFGPGSRIIIISENQRLLKGVDHIYEVDIPTTFEAFQMFCMHAFGQTTPKDGFMELAWKVIDLVDNLPLGLKIMGSYFENMSREDWEKELPLLKNRLDGDIEGVLKFSYDALNYEEKFVFLHIACLFYYYTKFEEVAEYLEKRFPNVRQLLSVLCEKSLISSVEGGYVRMNALLVQLGRDIVRKQSTEPGQRQFLNDIEDITEVLNTDAAGKRSVIGIALSSSGKININERAFEGMTNLEFLTVFGLASHGPSYLSPKLRLLRWTWFPMTCLPSPDNLTFLVELQMHCSKLEKLWEGNKSIRNLIRVDLRNSNQLKELPNLSTATSLKALVLEGCSSLVKVPISIGKAINLQELNLRQCSSLVKLPCTLGHATNLQILRLEGCSKLVEFSFSIRNATNLQKIELKGCSSLMQLPTFGNATNLQKIDLEGCSSLMKLPSTIGNATNLQELNLRQCSSLMKVPSTIGNATNLQKIYLEGCSSLLEMPFSIGIGNAILNYLIRTEVMVMDFGWRSQFYLDFKGYQRLLKIPSFIWNAINLEGLDFSGCSSFVEVPTSIGNLQKLDLLIFKGCSKLEVLPVTVNLKALDRLDLSGCSSLKTFPEISTNISVLDLSGTAIEEVPSSIRTWYRLLELRLKGCKNLVSLPQLPESLWYLNALNCESLERLDFFFSNSPSLKFANCFKLNKDARDIIIQTSSYIDSHVLPGKEIPIYFTHRANGGCLVLKLSERSFPSKQKFKACILLVSKNDIEDRDEENEVEDSDEEENNVKDRDEENDVKDRDEENDIEDGDEENDVEDGDEDNGIEDSEEENEVEDDDEENDSEDREDENEVEDGDEDNDSEDSDERNGVGLDVKIRDKHNINKRGGWIIEDPGFLHNSLREHLYVFTFEAYVYTLELFIEFSIDGDELVIKECGVCEADSAETKKRGMDQNGDTSVIIDTISKYTRNSEAGCSNKDNEMRLDEENVIKATHEHGEENMVQMTNALLSSWISVVPLVVGINGDGEAEDEVNGNNSEEAKKRKEQSPFMGTKRASEVGNNGDCEAGDEVRENDSAKTKKSRVS